MSYVFRDQHAWATAVCLGYAEWVARFANQKIVWQEDEQSMRQTITNMSVWSFLQQCWIYTAATVVFLRAYAMQGPVLRRPGWNRILL